MIMENPGEEQSCQDGGVGSTDREKPPSNRWLSRRVTRIVALLTVAVLIHNVAWVVALPAWQGPDEFSHYAYVEKLAAEHIVQRFHVDHDHPRNSKAADASFGATGFDPLRFRFTVRPFGAAGDDHIRFPPEKGGLAQHNTGPLGANNYPPAYYALAVPLYDLPWVTTATQREYWVRLLSALLGALVVPLTYRLAREVGVAFWPSMCACVLATTVPIMTQQSAVFSPDVLLVVAVTGLIASCARLRNRKTPRGYIYVAAWSLLGALSKPVGGPAVVAVVLVIAIVSFGQIGHRRRIALLAAVLMAGTVIGSVFGSSLLGVPAPVGVSWFSTLKFSAQYLWQYYLPRVDGMAVIVPPATPDSPPALWIWGREGVGIFAWLTTLLPEWAYKLAWIPTLVAGALASAGGMIGRSRDRSGRSMVAGIVAASFAYILVLHGSEALFLMATGNRLLQGRYFLPVYPAFAVAMMVGLSRFGNRVAIAVGGMLCIVWCVVAVESLNTVLVYFG